MTFLHRLLVLTTATAGAAAPIPAAADEPPRLYAGAGLVRMDHEGRFDGIRYEDTALGWQAYVGFRSRTAPWAIELVHRRLDGFGPGEIAGSGTDRLDLSADLATLGARAVVSVPLDELFGWRDGLQLFGAIGYYRSELDVTAVELASHDVERVSKRESGATLGGGVLYRLGRVGLRGYVERVDVGDSGAFWDLGIAVELGF